MHSSQAMGQKNRPRAVDPDGAQAGVLQAGLVVMCKKGGGGGVLKKGGWEGGGGGKGTEWWVFFFFFFFWLHFPLELDPIWRKGSF